MKMMSIVCAIGFWAVVTHFLMNKLQLNFSDLDWGFGGVAAVFGLFFILFVFTIATFMLGDD